MENKNVYVVCSFGGTYEDKWEYIEKVFTNKERMESYIDEMTEKRNKISDVEFNKINQFINDLRDNIVYKYFDEYTDKPLVDDAEEKLETEEEIFDTKTKYEIIESEFGYTKEDWDLKESDYFSEFSGYRFKEVELIED